MYKKYPSKAELSEAYAADGATMKSAARAFGISVGKVHQLIHAYGIKVKPKHGHPMTLEHRKQISERHRGKILSEETKHKMSEAKKMHKPGHMKKRDDGYISVYYPDHPAASSDGYVMQHRLLMEKEIGRYLLPNEVVHHKNHIRNDNRISNLQLMTMKEHMSLHMRERWEKKRRENNEFCGTLRSLS